MSRLVALALDGSFLGPPGLDLAIQPWVKVLVSIEDSNHCEGGHCIVDKDSPKSVPRSA